MMITWYLLASSLLLARLAVSNSENADIPVNVINLEKDKERWSKVVTELTEKGVPIEQIRQFPAVHGKSLSQDELKQNTTAAARFFCTPGMNGCFLSHRNLWIKTHNEAHEYQIVLEDDVLVSNNFLRKVATAIRELQDCDETKNSWDVLLLGAFSCIHPERKYGVYRVQAAIAGGGRKPRFVTPHCHTPYRPLGTHAYVVSKRGAAKLLKRCGAKANFHIDCVAWRDPKLNLYITHPLLAYQDMSSPSTVGGITHGLDTLIPKWRMDNYTQVSLEWALNEPFFRLGPFMVVTIGRYIAFTVGGAILSLILPQPAMLLLAHLVFAVGFAFLLPRFMMRPQGLPDV